MISKERVQKSIDERLAKVYEDFKLKTISEFSVVLDKDEILLLIKKSLKNLKELK